MIDVDAMPLAIDLYCGLGGWTEGLIAEGYRVVGFDIEQHVYGEKRYPAQLVIQDVLTLHGSQFKDAALIVASPPCQAYSYRAMPFKRAKALPPPSNALFDACFRIQREACEAAGRYIPMVVENVRGAQPWVGRAAWHFGSFYLWGDVPALMPIAKHQPKFIMNDIKNGRRRQVDGLYVDGKSIKNSGGSWFGERDGKALDGNPRDGVKVPSENGRRTDVGKGARFTTRDCGVEAGRGHNHPGKSLDGTKQGGDWFSDPNSMSRCSSSRSSARKAASAQVAKIPLALSQHIARVYKP